MEHLSVYVSAVIWVGVLFLLFFCLGVLGSKRACRFIFGKKKQGFIFLFRCFAFLFLLILLKVFFLEINRVSGRSMEDTLQDGDYLLIVKWGYGPRLPRSFFEIPWLNSVAYLCSSPETRRKYLTDNRDYRRVGSYSRVRKGDVVAFNLPPHQAVHLVKRCAGIPGERIFLPSEKFSTSGGQAHRVLLPFERMQTGADSLPSLYRTALAIYGKKTGNDTYTFEHNYYYMLGDHPAFSQDSRHWGLLQEDHIIGKAVCILFSMGKGGKIRWERCFKKIR